MTLVVDNSFEISNISFSRREFLLSYNLIIVALRDANVKFILIVSTYFQLLEFLEGWGKDLKQ